MTALPRKESDVSAHHVKIAGGGIGIAIVFFVAGHVVPFCFLGVCTEDGNPIGYHLYGQAKIDQSHALNLTSCGNNPCNLDFNFVIAKQGKPQPTATTCPSSNCLRFSASRTMTEWSKDDVKEHNDDGNNVSVEGTVTGP